MPEVLDRVHTEMCFVISFFLKIGKRSRLSCWVENLFHEVSSFMTGSELGLENGISTPPLRATGKHTGVVPTLTTRATTIYFYYS